MTLVCDEAVDIQTYVDERINLINRRLDQLVEETPSPYGVLYSAARYSLLGGGKRLRPLLAVATAEALGADAQTALTPACSLELIHAYSMIHDDLPCMDDDDFRRGKPTLHKLYPEGIAVLAGDFLLTYAFEVITKAPSLTAEQHLQLVSTLAQAAGGHGMVGGQVMDLEAEGKAIDLRALQLIHQCKTGALLSAAFEFGGIVANASDTTMKLLQKLGQQLGLAFQIVDDVLDVTASETKHGKAHSSDVTNVKTTYVSLMGVEASSKKARDLLAQSLELLEQLPGETHVLKALANRLVNRNM
ncbi:MAG: polyprenyl synthetase family protein [Chlamydiales bacterium]|nr:polyprenyl synthetase family protein [Chlamydiales bacterium]